MEEIKTTFPFIYIKQIDFYFIFELTLCDLFVKHGKNFFSPISLLLFSFDISIKEPFLFSYRSYCIVDNIF